MNDDVLTIHNNDGSETRVEHPFEALQSCPIHDESGSMTRLVNALENEQGGKVLSIIKHIVYHITLPIYLWSIGMNSLDEYIDALKEW